jgi:hypothetical protein
MIDVKDPHTNKSRKELSFFEEYCLLGYNGV